MVSNEILDLFRPDFEEWARRQPFIKDVQRYKDNHEKWGGKYQHHDTQRAFEVWVAAKLSRLSIPDGKPVYHAPGLGEVHSQDHSQMIYCYSPDETNDDTEVLNNHLAQRVWKALNNEDHLEAQISLIVGAASRFALEIARSKLALSKDPKHESSFNAAHDSLVLAVRIALLGQRNG